MKAFPITKETLKKPPFIISTVAGIIILIYSIISIYFFSHFSFNTEINGIDFSGKSADEVQTYFKEHTKDYALEIKAKDGKSDTISGESISLEYKENGSVEKALKKQHAFLWPMYLFSGNSENIKIEVTYDDAALTAQLGTTQAVTAQAIPSENARPEFNGEKYVVKQEVYGTTLDMEKLSKKTIEYISAFKPTLDLAKENCYTEPKYNSKSKEVTTACDTMNKYSLASITYPMTEPVVVDRQLISQWLTVDENMQVIFNTDAMRGWMSEFGNKYDTVGATRTFTTPTGKSATVTGGTYGWSIDEDTEFANLENSIKNGEVVTREPAYFVGGTAAAHAMPDWGNTFVEVDLSAQHMWYVVNGSIALETDVVTGEPIPEKITPEGTYTILDKKLNEVLIGETNPATGQPSYRTPVDYWMRVTWNGIGFHDAKWQAAFGGSLNQTPNIGSHGCINMPLDKAAALYDMLAVETPVIIHY